MIDELIRNLATRHDFALFTLDYQTMNYQHLDAAKRFVIDSQKAVLGHFRRYFEARQYRLLRDSIRQWRPDVVILNKEIDLEEWMSNDFDVPVVPYLHGYMELSTKLATGESSAAERRLDASPSRLYRRLAGESNPSSPSPGKCKVVICVSESTAAQLGRYWPHVTPIVVRNGVNHSRFFPTWEDRGYALCISRLVPHKNLELLVRSFKSTNYPLIIHGNLEVGSQRAAEYLHRLESLKGPLTKIVIHRDEDSMVELLQRSSIFLHPGRDEGFALAPLEAMACGKVVVGHNSGGTPEVIRNHGFLAGDDESEWASIAKRLMDSVPLRTSMGRDAYEYSTSYSWEKTSAEFERVLESIV